MWPKNKTFLIILWGLLTGGIIGCQFRPYVPVLLVQVTRQPTRVITKQPPSPTPTLSPSLTPTPTSPPTPTSTLVIKKIDSLPTPALFETDWSDRSIFAHGLIEAEQSSLKLLSEATTYHMMIEIQPDLRHLHGRQELLYTNQTDKPLTEIYFRLFPNLADGSTTISKLLVDGKQQEFHYELNKSALQVPLSPPLSPNKQIIIYLDFQVEVPAAAGGNYGTFAFLEQILALAHFYPLIPVYDDEGWNIEIAPPMGDVVYSEASFYQVQVTAPQTVTLVASGREVERIQHGQVQTVTFAAGPMRDFYLVVSDRFTVTQQIVGETTINSYAPVELSAGSDLALNQAAAALQIFNERFGPYPYTEFDLVTTTTSALGIEYPGLIALLVDLYQIDETNTFLLESVIAHEVVHQWFYGVVGNDQVDEPWLDEALAQYATLLYFADQYGPNAAALFRDSLKRRWERIEETDIGIGLPVRDYSAPAYSAIVYGRGPLFIEALAEEMGQETFAAFLQDYYRRYQWDEATGQDFKQVAEIHCECDLTPLFETWVYDDDDDDNEDEKTEEVEDDDH